MDGKELLLRVHYLSGVEMSAKASKNIKTITLVIKLKRQNYN